MAGALGARTGAASSFAKGNGAPWLVPGTSGRGAGGGGGAAGEGAGGAASNSRVGRTSVGGRRWSSGILGRCGPALLMPTPACRPLKWPPEMRRGVLAWPVPPPAQC